MIGNREKQTRSRAVAVALTRRASLSNPIYWLTALLVSLSLMLAATQANARPVPDSFADLAEKLLPSVVTISSTVQASAHAQQGPENFQFPPGSPFEEYFKRFFGPNGPQQQRPQRPPNSLGSGFIIDAKGVVVTNNHVIADAQEINVVMQDGTILKATLVGTDPETDIAVLKVDPKGLKLRAVKFGNSDKARVGDWVMAIGNPFGLGGTVTSGIISARGRDINAGRYDDFIQTDASINKGNSGGPLFNMEGEVIGINTMIYSPSGGSVGIGFSVPAAVAEPIVKQLTDIGRVRRGWLGVRIQTVTDELAESFGLDKAQGALVSSVTVGGPAEQAGIKASDIILEFNGREVEEMRKLPRIVAETPVDQTTEVTVWRDGKKIALKVKVGELDEERIAAVAPMGKAEPQKSKRDIEPLGLTVATLTDSLREQFELEPDLKGVVVVGVDEAGPAAEKGIQPGDLIVEVGQKEVLDARSVAKRVKEQVKEGRKSILLWVETQGGRRFIAVPVQKK